MFIQHIRTAQKTHSTSGTKTKQLTPDKYREIYSNTYPTRCNVTQFIYIWKLLYMFRVLLPPVVRSAYNCIYSNWYLSHPYCYLPLSWKSWNRFECAVGDVRHPQHEYIGILLGAHPILHISRIRVNLISKSLL
jgi:hypothetical protein